MTKFEVIFHERNYTNKLKARLIDYQKSLSNAVKHGYKGNANPNNIKWTFPGSVLYAVSGTILNIRNFKTQQKNIPKFLKDVEKNEIPLNY